jgi:dihydroorotate dehydrogenase (NAD+) catalytic subunit
MKAKKRVVVSGAGRPPDRPKRSPTARTIKSALVVPKPAKGARATLAPQAVVPPVVALGAPALAPAGPDRPGLRGGEAGPAAVDMRVDLGRGFVLENPVLVASGTFGYGVEYADVVEIDRLGAICCKGTTLRPRPGNRPPRVTETPAGMLNSIGLQNPGIDAVLERYAALWAGWSVPVLVNVAGESIDEYVGVVRRLEGMAGIAGIELNISCPNVGKGGLQFAIDAEAAASVTRAVRRVTELPLIVKLSPNVADVRPIAMAIAEAGADALSAINTLSGMALRPDRTGPFLGNTYGGLSGPAIKPVALRIVYEVTQVVDIPVIAIGGITCLDDVLDFLAVGAVAVQVGTDELRYRCAADGLASYRPLIGTALPRRPASPSARGAEYRP